MKGDVVVIPFPFSDGSSAKRRPALVLQSSGDDVLLAQITSVPHRNSIALDEADFVSGGLNRRSHARVDHLFTSDRRLILYRAGLVTGSKMAEFRSRLLRFLES